MLPIRSYLICTTPRSGSNLLCGGLASTKAAGYPIEAFPPRSLMGDLRARERRALDDPFDTDIVLTYEKEFDAKYVAGALRGGTTSNGIFGIKILWPQLPDALKRLENYLDRSDLSPPELLGRAFPRLSYIWLQRRDKLAQAISWCRALQTGEFRRFRDAAEAAEDPAAFLEFDYHTIRRLRSALMCFDNGWKAFFGLHGIVPISLVYEDLAQDYERTIWSTLQSLDISCHGAIAAPMLKKQADSISDDWARQFIRCSTEQIC